MKQEKIMGHTIFVPIDDLLEVICGYGALGGEEK